MIKTALFALVVCFISNDVMALSRNCSAGQYAYLSTQCKTCPENCWCPTNGSKQGTGWTTVVCSSFGTIGPSNFDGSIDNGSFDLNSCYLKNNLFPASDAGSDSVSDCYRMLSFKSYIDGNSHTDFDKQYAYLNGIDSTIYKYTENDVNFANNNVKNVYYIVKKCYNNSSGNATTCVIPKLPQSPELYGFNITTNNFTHLTGNWCYRGSYTTGNSTSTYSEQLEVVSSNSNTVTVRIPSDAYNVAHDTPAVVSVYPCEESNNYTLLFNANGAIGSPGTTSISCQCGTYYSMSTVGTMTKTGYKFVGWNTKADGSGTTYKASSSQNLCANDGATIVLYAIWEPVEVYISLNKNGGSDGLSAIYTTYNTGVYTDYERTTAMSTYTNPVTVPTKVGSTFQGYYSTSSGDGVQYISSNGFITSAGVNAAKGYASSTTWYARWSLNNYTISLNKNGGSDGAAAVYTTYNTGVYTDSARTTAMSTYANSITVPTKAGSTFQGYYSTSSGDGTQYIKANGLITSAGLNAAKGYTSDQNWYARWTPNNYTISLNKNGGYNGESMLYTTYNTGVYTDSARTTAMSTSQNPLTFLPKRDDWTFQGYYSTSESSGGTQYITSNGYITSAGLSAAKGYTSSEQSWYARWAYAGNIVNLYSNCPGGSNTLVATIGVFQDRYMPEYDMDNKRLSSPRCPGYRFLGYWDQTSGGAQYYDYTLLINDEDGGLDTKWTKSTGGNLYAHWEEIGDGLYVNIDSDVFEFDISAAGKFYVYWGDGTYDYQEFATPGNNHENFYHSYEDSGNYTVTITGTPYGYMADTEVPVIDFTVGWPSDIKSFDGSFGSVFPTLSNNTVGIGQPSFYRMCADCDNLTELSEGLFDGISGTPIPYMFSETFYDCDKLTTVTGQLFPTFNNNSISNADYLFYETFDDCNNLESISSNLFAGISGQPSKHMFDHTFYECNLTDVPDGLFSGIRGNVTEGLFKSTFSENDYLESVPANLISGLTGKPQSESFQNMFEFATEGRDESDMLAFKYTNDNTVPWIPPEFFANLDNSDYESGPMSGVFSSVHIATDCSVYQGYEQYFTGFEVDFDERVSCIKSANCASDKMHYNGGCIDPDFTLTTTSDTSEFAFHITASGTWYVDWGDGTIEQIHRENIANSFTNGGVDNTRYYHAYDNDGTYVIKMKGLATGYSNENYISAIKFAGTESEDNIYSVTGSLGDMFPIKNGKAPNFAELFNDAENLTSISGTLFSNITKCSDNMFVGAFYNTAIQTVPSGLFSSITNSCPGMFLETFASCSNLTTINQNVFPHIVSCDDNMYAYTFQDCSNLQTIPSDLFEGNEGGCQEMFEYTFSGSGVTAIPDGLFADIESTGSYMFDHTFADTKITSVPRNMFPNLSLVDEGLFSGMFSGCKELTTISADLISDLDDDDPAEYAFYHMFYGANNLQYFEYEDGTKVSYIPSTFFGNMENSEYAGGDNVATGIFGDNTTYNGGAISNNTKILETCPAGTTEFNSKFKTEYAPKVSCVSGASEYTITFKTWDADLGTQTVTQNTSQNLNTISSMSDNIPEEYQENGWTFYGWATSTDTTTRTYTDGQSINNINSNITLYAIWQREVSFTYYATADATTPTTSTRTQYLYNMTENGDDTSIVATSVEAYPLVTSTYGWEPIGWSIYSSGEGVNTEEPDYTEGIEIDLSLEDPVNWYAVYRRTIHVQYYDYNATDQQTISHNYQYMNSGSQNAEEYIVHLGIAGQNNEVDIADIFKPAGYSFVGWAPGSVDGTPVYARGADFTFPNTSWTSNATYSAMYSKWTADTYTVTYDINYTGGTNPADATYTVGGSGITLPTVTREGYTLDGWYTESSSGIKINSPYTPSSDITLYAHWTLISCPENAHIEGSECVCNEGYSGSPCSPITYNIRYEGMEDATFGTNHPTTATYDTLFTVDNPTKTGYKFTGWSMYLLPGTAPESVAYNVNGGTDGVSITAVPGEEATFIYYAENLIQFKNLRKTNSSTVKLTAKWTKQCGTGYDVINNNCVCVAPKIEENGVCHDICPTGYSYKSITEHVVLPKTEITSGRYKSLAYPSGGSSSNVEDMSNGYYNVVWESGVTKGSLTGVSSCTGTTGEVRYETVVPDNTFEEAENSGSNCWCKPVSWTPYGGDSQELSSDWVFFQNDGNACSKECSVMCYTFFSGGPNYINQRNDFFDNVKIISEDCVPNTYTVTYDANGGSVNPGSAQYTVGGDALTLPTPIYSGYNFDGWYTASNGGTKINSPYTPTGNITLYAHWAQNTINLLYKYNDINNTETTDMCVYDGSPFSVPRPNMSTINRPGYRFMGWKYNKNIQ